MNYDHFVNQVQHRAHLSSNGEAVAAIRATLETLGERLAGGESKDLAAQLPREIGYYLLQRTGGVSQRFGFDEFCWRVAQREDMDLPKAVFHTRAVMDVVRDAVSSGEIQDVMQQLPPEFRPLFAGSSGTVNERAKGRKMNREPGDSDRYSEGRRHPQYDHRGEDDDQRELRSANFERGNDYAYGQRRSSERYGGRGREQRPWGLGRFWNDQNRREDTSNEERWRGGSQGEAREYDQAYGQSIGHGRGWRELNRTREGRPRERIFERPGGPAEEENFGGEYPQDSYSAQSAAQWRDGARRYEEDRQRQSYRPEGWNQNEQSGGQPNWGDPRRYGREEEREMGGQNWTRENRSGHNRGRGLDREQEWPRASREGRGNWEEGGRSRSQRHYQEG
jgi:uncharacterized protein (DUF2267 family)